MAALVALAFVTLRRLEHAPLPGWDGTFARASGATGEAAATPGPHSAILGALLCVAGAATLASVGWGLKDQGLYCVALLLATLVGARALASQPTARRTAV